MMKKESLYSRTELLVGADAVKRLKDASVAVFGCGGVGSYIIEALARAGVGRLVIIDGDLVCASNLNRQIIATEATVGMDKTAAAKDRILSINPGCIVEAHQMFYCEKNADGISLSGLSYIADAIDTVSSKLLIIERAISAGVPVISCMGTGNKLSAELFKIEDISKTSVCPLAHVMRHELRKRGIEHVPVLYSTEKPSSAVIEVSSDGRRTIASISYAPAVAGLLCAQHIIRGIIG